MVHNAYRGLAGWVVWTALFILATPARSQTAVEGTLTTNTVWTIAGSPYYTQTGIVVAQGVTLTIEPGVNIGIAQSKVLQVRGTLNAVGTSNQPIRFSSPSFIGGYGGAITFTGVTSNTPALGDVRYCEFTLMLANSVYYSAVFSSQYADLTITHCTFRNLLGTGVRLNDSRIRFVDNFIDNTGEVINLVRCAGTVSSNLVSQVIGYADGVDIDLAWLGSGDPTIIIENNLLDGGPDPGADGIDFGTANNVIFRNNIVRNFGDKGLSIGESSKVIGYNNLISGCNIGIAIKDSSTPDLSNCTIVKCNFGVRAYQKNFGMGGGKGTVTNSIIWNCTNSVSLENGSTTTFGFCDIQGTNVWPGPGNITNNPSFVDILHTNVHLNADSPCLNRGTNQTWMAGAVDLDGLPRISGTYVDMGVYERVDASLVSNLLVTLPAFVQENAGTLASAGMVTLSQPSTQAVNVILTSAIPGRLTITNSVDIPIGQTNVQFDLAPVNDSLLNGDVAVSISAAASGYLAGQAATVVQDDESGTLSLLITSPLTEGMGVVPNAGQVLVDQPPTSAFTVTLTSGSPSILQVPASVILPQGATSVQFSVTVPNDNQITGPRWATVSAHVARWTDGTNAVQILDNESTNLTLTIPSQATEGSGTMINSGLVSIAGTLTNNLVVALFSDSSNTLVVTPLVTITSGQTQARFNLSFPDNLHYDDSQSVAVVANASGFGSNQKPLLLFDNDAHHFGFGNISSPQTNHVSFPIAITAYTHTDAIQYRFTGTVSIAAANVDGSVPHTPTSSGVFNNGAWSSMMAITTVVDSVILTVTDPSSATGNSTAFDVGADVLDHFTWDPVPSPQYATVPFTAGITACDQYGYRVNNFTNPVALSGWEPVGIVPAPLVLIAEIDHTSPDAAEFVNAGATPVNISGWQITFYDFNSWPAPLTTFVIPNGTTLATGAVFTIVENGVSPGTFPSFFTGGNINWTGSTRAAILMRDASGNIIDFACANNATPSSITAPVAIPTNQWFGNPIPAPLGSFDYARYGSVDTHTSNDWQNVAPGIGTRSAALQLPFQGASILPANVAVAPTNSSPLLAGRWLGSVSVLNTSSNMFLRAQALVGAAKGESTNFPVRPADYDGDADQMQDAWERQFFGSLARDGSADNDGDGMSDAGEHEAGTNPTNALEVLRTTAVWVQTNAHDLYFAWPTVSGRFYSVYWTTNLLGDLEWMPDPACVDVPGGGAPLTFSNTPPADPHRFYKIGVRRNTN